jgi:predicted transcriptional regulator
MADAQQPTSVNRERTTQIVAAYARRNQVAADALPALISTVHEALGRLGTTLPEPAGERTPAVPVRPSVHRDYVVCIECGWRGQMLRRHIAGHGLSVEQYRARWNLKPGHPITAPGYSERRSTMAKQIGLGRGRGAFAERKGMHETKTVTTPQPSPTRRGRPRSKVTSTAPA